jgi:hypothetical protein
MQDPLVETRPFSNEGRPGALAVPAKTPHEQHAPADIWPAKYQIFMKIAKK